MEITYIRGLLFQGIMPHVSQNKLKKIKFYKGRLYYHLGGEVEKNKNFFNFLDFCLCDEA